MVPLSYSRSINCAWRAASNVKGEFGVERIPQAADPGSMLQLEPGHPSATVSQVQNPRGASPSSSLSCEPFLQPWSCQTAFIYFKLKFKSFAFKHSLALSDKYLYTYRNIVLRYTGTLLRLLPVWKSPALLGSMQKELGGPGWFSREKQSGVPRAFESSKS